MIRIPSWLRRDRAPQSSWRAARPALGATLALECLEDRIVPAFAITTTSLLTLVTVNDHYSAMIQTQGGSGVMFQSDTLPTGMTLNAITGEVAGTPSVVGERTTFTVTATDGQGDRASATFTSTVLPPQFTFNASTNQLTIALDQTEPNFQFTQATVGHVNASASTTFTFAVYNQNVSVGAVVASVQDADFAVANAQVHGTVVVHGVGGTAVLVTNDVFHDPNTNTIEETAETVSLGAQNNPGVGSISKSPNNDPTQAAYSFLTIGNFPTSYAYVGRSDGTVTLYGSAGLAFNGFVSAGNYSYIGGPGMYHEAQGAASVYGYSAGQASDFAYHYSANAGSAYVVSGTAFSYMSTTDLNHGVTQSFFNVGVGFLLNTGVSMNPGRDFAYLIDSPGNDIFVGASAFSYMYISASASSSSFVEFDAAFGFASYSAQSFVGGADRIDQSGSSNISFSGSWVFSLLSTIFTTTKSTFT